MKKLCFLCEIIYKDDVPDIKSMVGSKNFLAVLKEEKDRFKKIIILPKKPDLDFTRLSKKIKREYDKFLPSVASYIHHHLRPKKMKDNSGFYPCDRGISYGDNSKFHQCIIFYIE